jgi:tetratricopeptide (TPR) repeat protein
MTSGASLFQLAELAYARNRFDEALEYYQQSIKKILKDESVTAKLPVAAVAQLPVNYPRETLGLVWHNFVGMFRDPTMNFNKETSPKAYKLLTSFKPSAPDPHPQFQKMEKGRILLKGLQIAAAFTLGIMAWDKRDRATAAKRYKEAIELGATHPPFVELPPGAVGMDVYIHATVKEAKDNLDILMGHDAERAQAFDDGDVPQRKEVVDMLNLRVGGTGEPMVEQSYMFATDACGNCGKRDVKLMRCSRCKKMPCE